jgi:hypothetical protein
MLLCVAASVVIGGCATPKYQYRAVKLNASPSVPLQQAKEICSAKAQIAGQQAANAAASQSRASRTPSETYDCSSTAAFSTVSTTCNRSASDGMGEAIASVGDAVVAEDARKRTGATVFRGCLAEYGWGVQRRCVENCK